MRKGLTCLLCLWMVLSLPIPSLADTGADSSQQQNARLEPAPQAGAVSQAGPAPQPGPASQSGSASQPGPVSQLESAPQPEPSPQSENPTETQPGTQPEVLAETPPETGGTDQPPADESKKDQAAMGSLQVEEYALFRHESSKNALDTLYQGRSGRLVVTLQSDTLMTGDVKSGEIIITKERDSYRTTGSPVVKIDSKKGEKLAFKVTFPKITYDGRDTVFGFHVKYKSAVMEPIPLYVDITEANEADASDGKGRDGSEANSPQPVIKVERSGISQSIGAGESAEITLRLTNMSKSSDMEDLVVSFAPGESMYLTDDTNSRIIKRLYAGKSTEVKVKLQAGQDLSGASQTVDVEMKFNYYSANHLTSGTSTQKIIIPVKGNSGSGQPMLRIDRVGQETIRAGEQFQAVIRLENTSQNKDVTGLTVILEPTEHISLMDATDTRLIGELKAGAAVDIPVSLKASAEMSESASQLLGVNLKFDYDSGKGVTQGTYSSKVVIPTVGGASKIGSPTPNIIIRSYSYGDSVEAGQVFDLVMEVSNTSSTMPVENVLMSLDTGEGISINDSSNTIYIPSMAPGAVETKTVKVQALFQSKLQSPKIEITFKYEFLDKKERKQNSTQESIAIPVYQPDRLEIKMPVFADAVRENEEAVISLPYSNKGRGQVYNVEAKLEGEIDILERELTMGNFESGKNGSIDFVVTPRVPGKFEGKVIIAYEDEAMKRKEMTVPVSFDVQASAPVTDAELEDEIPETGKHLPSWLFVPGILVFAGGIFLTVRNKNRKRKAQELPENSDGEPWEELEDEE